MLIENKANSVLDRADNINEGIMSQRLMNSEDDSFSNGINLSSDFSTNLSPPISLFSNSSETISAMDTVTGPVTNVVRSSFSTSNILSKASPRQRNLAIRKKINVMDSERCKTTSPNLTVKRNSMSHHKSTGDLLGDVKSKKGLQPNFISSSFWNLFEAQKAIINSAAELKKKRSESLIDISKISLSKNKSAKRELNSDLKKSKSSCYLNEFEDRHPWSCITTSEDEDSSSAVTTTNSLDKEKARRNKLTFPRPSRTRSRSPMLGTIESVDFMEEDKPICTMKKPDTLSTVHEILEKSESTKSSTFSKRRMSAVLPSFMTNSNPETSTTEGRNSINRRSLKVPSSGSTGSNYNCTVVTEPWNKMRIKYWKQRMSVQGIKFPSMGNNGIIQNFKREPEGSYTSPRPRKYSTTSIYGERKYLEQEMIFV